MKKFFTLFFFLLAAIASNAEQYPLNVKGVTITDDNKADILGDGKVKFDNSTNTLTFTDADITYDQYIVGATMNWKENLNIKFEGKNTFTVTGKNSAIYIGAKGINLTLWSDEYTKGSLTINMGEEGNNGIENGGHSNIILQSIDLNINANNDGIGPLNSSPTTEKLIIDKCNIAINCQKRAALRFTEVELIDCKYIDGYALNGTKSTGCTYDGTVMKDVRVGVDTYGIWVSGEEVTAKNMHNILLDEAPYTMYFEPKTNELTLNNVNYNSESKNAIWVKNDNTSSDKTFKINLVGKNVITSSVTDDKAILVEAANVDSVLIYSVDGGSLDVTSPSEYATLSTSNKLTIKDCTVNIRNTNASAPAFKGMYFCFINSNFSAETAGQDVFNDVLSLDYDGCFMTTPDDGFLSSKHTLESKNSTNKFVVVPGVDNIKPNFYYGDTPSVKSVTNNSVTIFFSSAMDNLTAKKNIRYNIRVAKADAPEAWVKDYDLNNSSSGNEHETEITELEPETKYILRIKATDEAGNYNEYKDVEFTTLEETTSINDILTNGSDTKIYTISGVQTNKNYRGIIVKNGKKVMTK